MIKKLMYVLQFRWSVTNKYLVHPATGEVIRNIDDFRYHLS